MSRKKEKTKQQLRVQTRNAWMDAPRHLSRYEAGLAVLGGLIMLAPAWRSIRTARGEVGMIGFPRTGSTAPQASGPSVQAGGVFLGLFALGMILVGIVGLLVKRRA